MGLLDGAAIGGACAARFAAARDIALSNPTSAQAQFGPPSREAWLALVEKTLKGGSLDKLTSKTRDGLSIAPLYREGPAAAVRAGPHDPVRPWDLRTLAAHPDPARANADILEDLQNGAASVLLRIDPSGRNGVAVAGQDDHAKALDGVLLELAPGGLDAAGAGQPGP
jgi:methylmalonyl-CoA mutase